MDNEDQQRDLLTQLIAVSAEIELIKKKYEELDQITLALRDCGFTQASRDGRTYVLTDNFAEKNVAYRVSFIRRFEIKATKERA